LLILLRIAIGWHFLNEGVEKIKMSQMGGAKPFSAEGYLRNATGPLAPYYRGIVPDVNGLAKLDPERLKAGWADDVHKIARHYRFDTDQEAAAEAELHKAEADADTFFLDKEFRADRQKYYHELAEVQKVERNRSALSYERQRAADRRKDLDVERKKLVQDLDAIGGALHEAVNKLATDSERKQFGVYPGYVWTKLRIPWRGSTLNTPIPVPDWNSLEWVNFLTKYGLVAMGACLILGLLTRPAALAGAVFLAQIYLSMPPWPGYPRDVTGPEHFYIVDMHLIEMLACLFLATTRSGRWIGLDALLFNWIGRRRVRNREETQEEPDRQRGRRGPSASQPKSH
jgi:uncharacterized membrane protein YphA (DoxX/SURF4 family)